MGLLDAYLSEELLESESLSESESDELESESLLELLSSLQRMDQREM